MAVEFAYRSGETWAEPGDDLVSGPVAEGEDVASAMWIMGLIFTMITGGNNTVTGMLSSSAVLLDRHRDQRRMLIDDPSAIPDAVEELLRFPDYTVDEDTARFASGWSTRRYEYLPFSTN